MNAAPGDHAYIYGVLPTELWMDGSDGNLLSIYDPSYRIEARVEMEDLLSMVHAETEIVGPGLGDTAVLQTLEAPRKVVARLSYLHRIAPERFEFTRIWLPADRWCRSELGEIADLVSEAGEKIEEGETWKIVLQRTESPIENIGRLIDTLSHCVLKPNPDMMGPRKVIYIHVIGQETAVSLLDPDDMLKIPPRVPAIWIQDGPGRIAVD